MTYAVIIARGGRNDRASVPDLPGCMATGKTREDTTRVMRDAIAFHRQGLQEDGLPIPESTTRAESIEAT
jgi:predicted RNase H-like HicB family nuclease